jgi:hypothetical protein
MCINPMIPTTWTYESSRSSIYPSEVCGKEIGADLRMMALDSEP